MSRQAGRQAVLLKLLLCMSLAITGCRGNHELNELHIVHSAAFDVAEDGKVFVTAEIARLTPGGQQPKGMQDQTFYLSEKGNSIFEAGRYIRSKSDRTLLWGHTTSILISSQLAKQGLKRHIESIRRLRQFRNSTLVYITEGKASDTLRVKKPMTTITSQVLRGLTEGGDNTALTTKVTLVDIYTGLINQYRDLVIPSIQVVADQDAGQQKLLQAQGLYLFQGDHLTGQLSDEYTKGYMRANNNMIGSFETVACTGGQDSMSFENINNRAEIHVMLDINSKPRTQIDIRTDLNLNSVQCNDIPITPATIRKWESQLNKSIGNEVENFLRYTQKHKSDVLGIGERLHRKYPKQWAAIKPRWRELYAEMEVEVKIHSRIDHTNFIVLQPDSYEGTPGL